MRTEEKRMRDRVGRSIVVDSVESGRYRGMVEISAKDERVRQGTVVEVDGD